MIPAAAQAPSSALHRALHALPCCTTPLLPACPVLHARRVAQPSLFSFSRCLLQRLAAAHPGLGMLLFLFCLPALLPTRRRRELLRHAAYQLPRAVRAAFPQRRVRVRGRRRLGDVIASSSAPSLCARGLPRRRCHGGRRCCATI